MPIGVFDSGIGGLTVLKSLAMHFPQENFLYIGDTARLPYGSKSPETIRKYSEQIMNFLAAQGVKALIIACNSASSQVSEHEWNSIPLYNVIGPGAIAAAKATVSQKVGVLGTRATIQSGSYQRAIQLQNPKIQVFSQACPLFVPLAEEGWIDDPLTNLIVYRYVQPIIAADVDTLVLGCTHYPLLKQSIVKAVGQNVQLIDCGQSVSAMIEADLRSGRIPRSTAKKGKIQVWCTDLSSQFARMAETTLDPLQIDELCICNL